MPNKKIKGFRRRRKSCPPTVNKVPNRSGRRKKWSREQMEAAMECALSGNMSINRAAEFHGVPRTTLQDRLSGRVEHGKNPGPAPYLTSNEEKELCDYLLSSAEVGYGKTRKEVKCIAEAVAKEKCVLKASGISDGWWRRFLQRNPSISLRSGDATANIRMESVNVENITAYFDLLKEVYDELELNDHPECIYNMDETGMPLEPRPPKVVSKKGAKKIRYRTSGQKAQITIIGCGNAVGQAQPPFIIYAAKQLNHLWTRGDIVGSRYAVSDKGWIDQELFFFWFKEHFLTHAVNHRPLLLLLDGHSSHFEPATIKFAKENNVAVFCLPPHTTHECQPLDCSFFGPLKKHWQEVCHSFYQENPGQVISKLNFCRIFKPAWLKTITPENIINGFKKAGVFPYNPSAIPLPKASKGDEDSKDDGDNDDGGGSGEEGDPEESGETRAAYGRGKKDGAGDCHSLDGGAGYEDEHNGVPNHSDGAGIRHGDGEKAGNNDGRLDRDGAGDTVSGYDDFSGGERGDQDSSSGHKARETFTQEQVELYTRRFEEGYDLYDSAYVAWLEVTHPEAVPADRYMLITAPATSGVNGLPKTSASVEDSSTNLKSTHASMSGSTSPVPDTSHHSGSSVKYSHSNLQSASSSGSASPVPDNSGASAKQATPSLNTSTSSSSPSPLSLFLKPLPPSTTTPKSSKGTSARVLTRSECLALMEEKERKKKQAAEEKEQRKQEREEKKKQRQEELKRKAEERQKKAEERRRKAEEKKRQVEEKAKRRESVKAKKVDEKNRAQKERKKLTAAADAHVASPPDQVATPDTSCDEPRSKRSRLDMGDMTDVIDPNVCCTCFGLYEDDAGTGREWLQCQCGRWMHEDCVEECDFDGTGNMKICPLC